MSAIDPYKPPFFLFNAHLETIYPALFRKVNLISYQRERFELPDGDFLDLDWLKQQSRKLIIIQHGLEGNTSRGYIKGMAKIFFENGFDVLTWNFRGCGEEMNRLLRFYHSGATEDLKAVIEYTQSLARYEEISLVGFSLGGNLTLKYLGECAPPAVVKSAAVFSVPLDLHASCLKISKPSNIIYSRRFLNSLKLKIETKARTLKDLEIKHLKTIRTLIEFDDAYTAPLHGYKNARDYYDRCSSLNFLKSITIPTLVVNTLNDPFLSKECFPVAELANHPFVRLEVYNRGGHVGFAQFNSGGIYWSEQRALDWITTHGG